MNSDSGTVRAGLRPAAGHPARPHRHGPRRRRPRGRAQLIDEIFLAAFDNPWLRQGNDGAAFAIPAGHRIVMATDGHVISPLFFPGGDIGALSVHGTVNDVAMMGATPLLPGGQLHPRRRLSAGRPEAHRAVDGGGGPRGRRAGHHRRHQGGRTGQGRRRVHQHHRRRRGAARHRRVGRERQRRRRHPAVRHRLATTAWPCCRSANRCSSTPPSRRTPRRCTRWSPRCWPPRRPSACCATRRAAAWPPR
jgi:hypothetical protein